MKLRDVVNTDQLRALRAIALQVEEERRQRQADEALAKSLGKQPGEMNHTQLHVLSMFRAQPQGEVEALFRNFRGSKGRFSWRVASQKQSNRRG